VKLRGLALSLLVTALLVPSGGLQLRPSTPPGRIEAAKHPLVLEPPLGPQSQKLDAAKIHQEADELAKLAQSVPADIDQIAQGKLPNDFADKLKRIEKLSKHMRGELTQ